MEDQALLLKQFITVQKQGQCHYTFITHGNAFSNKGE